MKNETTKFSVSRAILVISNRIKHWALIIFPLCFFFISCNGSKKQSAGQEVNEVKLQTEDILFTVITIAIHKNNAIICLLIFIMTL